MSFATTTEMSEKWGILRRRITRLCGEGRIEGAELKGNIWLIPESTEKPDDPRRVRKKMQNTFYNIAYPVKDKKYTTIELFAGAGGLALGVEKAGFYTAGLIEFDKDACETLKKNRPDWRVICDDIANISKVDLEKYFGILLINAVESSRFMTESQSRKLVEKLITLTSEVGVAKLNRNVHVLGCVKAENKQIFYIVDAINEAINEGRRISFQYIDYNSRKEVVLRNDGKHYTVSPYSLVWNGDYYYLVGYYHEKEDVRTFRVDRIKQQPNILKTALDTIPEDFDITRYTREVFRMYDSEEIVPVTLQCENEVMKGILDAFGMDIEVKRGPKGHFRTMVRACLSPTFYAWVFQWEGKVQIINPKVAVDAYEKMIKQIVMNLELGAL